MTTEARSRVRKGAAYFAMLVGLGMIGFVAGGFTTTQPAVAASCEDEVCSLGDCGVKFDWDCDEEPSCTHTPCAGDITPEP